MGPGAGDAMLKPTVNIGTIKGGVKINMIPASCVFEAEIRLSIGMTAGKVLAKIDSILKDYPEASYEVQQAASNPPAFSSHTHEMIGHIQSNANATGKEKTHHCQSVRWERRIASTFATMVCQRTQLGLVRMV